MKLSNYIPSKPSISELEKQTIESYFFGENKFTNNQGVVLNKTWQISVLTGIDERKVDRHLNYLLYEKRKKMKDEQ